MSFRSYAGLAERLLFVSALLLPATGCGDDDTPADGSIDLSDSGASEDGSVAMDGATSDAALFDGATVDGFTLDAAATDAAAIDGGEPDASSADSGPDAMSVDADAPRDTSPPSDGGVTPDSGRPHDAGSPPDAGSPRDSGLPRDTGATFDAGDDCRRDFTAVYEITADDDNPSGCPFDGSFCTARQDPFNEVEITCEPFLPFSCTLDGCECSGFVSTIGGDYNYFINFGTERLTIVVGGRICEYDFQATAVPPS